MFGRWPSARENGFRSARTFTRRFCRVSEAGGGGQALPMKLGRVAVSTVFFRAYDTRLPCIVSP